MAEIAPFAALRYAADRVGNLADVLSPPYDVIGDRERGALEARNPHNVVRLELPRGDGGAAYARAAAALAAWTAEGVVRPDARPAFYVYEQQFSWPPGPSGRRHTRRGVFAAVRLEPFERRVVLPHEHTLSGPKEDRRRLLLATRTQISPIFGLYRDADGGARAIVDGAATSAPELDLETGDGVRHRVWTLADDAAIARFAARLGDKQILIADGHHRYETMLGLRGVLRAPGGAGAAAADYTMMFLCPAEDPGLLVLPTHRLVSNLSGFDFGALCAAAAPAFEVTRGDESSAAAIEARLARDGARRVVFAARVPGESATTWFALRPALDLSALGPPALRTLDVTVLHGVILGSLLGIDAAALANQSNLSYTHDTSTALSRIAACEAQVGFLMNPTKIEQVLAACEAGFVLPQKSTYFQPKLATGLVMYSLDRPAPRPPV